MNILDTIVKNSPHLSWIKDRTIFLTIHGSRAYNTHIPESDYDWRGIAVPSQEYLYGFSKNFEQAILQAPDPDTCIFGLKKFFQLASQCNPNCIEILYTDPSSHKIVNKLGQKLIDNRDLFLSKRIKHTTSGYAHAQFRKLKLHREHIIHPPKAPPTRKEIGLPEQTLINREQYEAATAAISKELEKYNFDFLDDIGEPQKIAVKNAWHDMLTELKISTEDQWLGAARTIGLSDNFIEIMRMERSYRNAHENYKKFLHWKKSRNPERYAMEEKFGYDGKFAMHLVRITREGMEALETGKMNVLRLDREELLEIRNGLWKFEQIEEFVEKSELKMQDLYNACTILPHHPDMNKLENLCLDITSGSF